MFGEEAEGEVRIPAEKREFPRVPMNVSVRYRQLSSEESTKALGRVFDADALLEKFEDGETKNVSKGGILMYTNEELSAKSFLVVNMYISIPGISCNCKALAEVIRRDRSNDASKWLYTVALKFHKIMHHNLKSYKFLNLNDLLDVRETGSNSATV
jgi:hypothetical protein